MQHSSKNRFDIACDRGPPFTDHADQTLLPRPRDRAVSKLAKLAMLPIFGCVMFVFSIGFKLKSQCITKIILSTFPNFPGFDSKFAKRKANHRHPALFDIYKWLSNVFEVRGSSMAVPRGYRGRSCGRCRRAARGTPAASQRESGSELYRARSRLYRFRFF